MACSFQGKVSDSLWGLILSAGFSLGINAQSRQPSQKNQNKNVVWVCKQGKTSTNELDTVMQGCLIVRYFHTGLSGKMDGWGTQGMLPSRMIEIGGDHYAKDLCIYA